MFFQFKTAEEAKQKINELEPGAVLDLCWNDNTKRFTISDGDYFPQSALTRLACGTVPDLVVFASGNFSYIKSFQR